MVSIRGWILMVLLNSGMRQSLAKTCHQEMDGDFMAGSMILTQEALDEAPYRYGDMLRKALDKVEKMEIPTQVDERQCKKWHRLEPSGKPPVIN